MAGAVVHGGKIVYAKGFGVHKVGRPETIDEDTVFQIAPVFKSVGSTVVRTRSATAPSAGRTRW
jgi:CubicO group peptidase (beta-lactamase class C family)